MPNLILLTRPSLQILGKTQTRVSPISGQSLIKVNCHNTRTSDDIDINLGPVTKLNKRNKTTSKKFEDDVMSANHDVIIVFPIYCQLGAIRKLDSGRIVCNLLSSTQLSHYYYEKRYYFCKKMLTSAKSRGPWYWKIYFLKLNVCVCVCVCV